MIGLPICDLVATPGAFSSDQLSIHILREGPHGNSKKAASGHCM